MRQQVVTGEGLGDLDRCGAPVEVPSPVERGREERRQIMHDVPELSEQFSTVWAYGFGHLDHGPLDAATRAADPSVVVTARRRQRRRTPSHRSYAPSWPSRSGDGCYEPLPTVWVVGGPWSGSWRGRSGCGGRACCGWTCCARSAGPRPAGSSRQATAEGEGCLAASRTLSGWRPGWSSVTQPTRCGTVAD